MGINLAKIVAKSLKSAGKPLGVKSCTLIKLAPGTRGSTVSGGTNPASTSYPATGFIELLTADDVPGTEIQRNDRKISILGATLPAGIIPDNNDKITITDLDGTSKTFRLVQTVAGDGVGAVFAFSARL